MNAPGFCLIAHQMHSYFSPSPPQMPILFRCDLTQSQYIFVRMAQALVRKDHSQFLLHKLLEAEILLDQ